MSFAWPLPGAQATPSRRRWPTFATQSESCRHFFFWLDAIRRLQPIFFWDSTKTWAHFVFFVQHVIRKLRALAQFLKNKVSKVLWLYNVYNVCVLGSCFWVSVYLVFTQRVPRVYLGCTYVCIFYLATMNHTRVLSLENVCQGACVPRVYLGCTYVCILFCYDVSY